MNLHILPLTLSQMMDAGLVGRFDQDGNALGYLVIRFGNAGRADFWDGRLCWWSLREFNPKHHSEAIFETPKQAKHFIERKSHRASSSSG